jgi:hypothetical protein
MAREEHFGTANQTWTWLMVALPIRVSYRHRPLSFPLFNTSPSLVVDTSLFPAYPPLLAHRYPNRFDSHIDTVRSQSCAGHSLHV